MADYPKYPILDSSQVSRIDGYEPKRASNGTLKVRKTMATEKREFAIEHLLNKTDYLALETFFSNNKELDVTLYWPGDSGSYTVRFIAAPARTQLTNYLYRVQVKLAQT